MDKRSTDPLWAVVDLALMDAWSLGRIVTVPLVLGVQILTVTAHYVAPPLGGADSTDLREAQESLGLILLGLLTVFAWLVRRHRDDGPYLSRLASTPALIADVLSLATILVGTSALWGCLSLYRISGGTAMVGAASTLASLAPLVSLAPGLARLRLGPSLFAALAALVGAGLVGFFGRTFPMRADTFFDVREASRSWPADGMATAAGLLISLGITTWRRPEPTCG